MELALDHRERGRDQRLQNGERPGGEGENGEREAVVLAVGVALMGAVRGNVNI